MVTKGESMGLRTSPAKGSDHIATAPAFTRPLAFGPRWSDGACDRHLAFGTAARDTFHALLGDHERIHRAVEEIEGGVSTTTLSEDPATAKKIRVHVRQMQSRISAGDGLRHWDPLFVEVFKHHDEIVMAIEDSPLPEGYPSPKVDSAN